MEKTTSIIKSLPSTKAQMTMFISKVSEELKDGFQNPLDFYLQAKYASETLKKLLEDKDIKDLAITEARRYGKSFESNGNKIEYSENMSPKYDFTVCGDREWDELQAQLSKLQEKIKEREAFLKAIPQNSTIMDEDGVQLLPPLKKSSEGLRITIK